MTVVTAARLFVADPEGVDAGAGRMAKCDAAGGRMGNVVQIDVPAIGALGTLHAFLDHARHGYRPPVAFALDVNGSGLNTAEVPDEGGEGGHGPSSLAAGNGGDGFALIGAGSVVDDKADIPVAF